MYLAQKLQQCSRFVPPLGKLETAILPHRLSFSTTQQQTPLAPELECYSAAQRNPAPSHSSEEGFRRYGPVRWDIFLGFGCEFLQMRITLGTCSQPS